VFGILLISFVIVQFAPGGPVERVLAQKIHQGLTKTGGNFTVEIMQWVMLRAGGIMQKINQLLPQTFGIGRCCRWPEVNMHVAIGLKQRNINPIHGCSADHANDCFDRGRPH
jgi:hypothetical protein